MSKDSKEASGQIERKNEIHPSSDTSILGRVRTFGSYVGSFLSPVINIGFSLFGLWQPTNNGKQELLDKLMVSASSDSPQSSIPTVLAEIKSEAEQISLLTHSSASGETAITRLAQLPTAPNKLRKIIAPLSSEAKISLLTRGENPAILNFIDTQNFLSFNAALQSLTLTEQLDLCEHPIFLHRGSNWIGLPLHLLMRMIESENPAVELEFLKQLFLLVPKAHHLPLVCVHNNNILYQYGTSLVNIAILSPMPSVNVVELLRMLKSTISPKLWLDLLRLTHYGRDVFQLIANGKPYDSATPAPNRIIVSKFLRETAPPGFWNYKVGPQNTVEATEVLNFLISVDDVLGATTIISSFPEVISSDLIASSSKKIAQSFCRELKKYLKKNNENWREIYIEILKESLEKTKNSTSDGKNAEAYSIVRKELKQVTAHPQKIVPTADEKLLPKAERDKPTLETARKAVKNSIINLNLIIKNKKNLLEKQKIKDLVEIQKLVNLQAEISQIEESSLINSSADELRGQASRLDEITAEIISNKSELKRNAKKPNTRSGKPKRKKTRTSHPPTKVELKSTKQQQKITSVEEDTLAKMPSDSPLPLDEPSLLIPLVAAPEIIIEEHKPTRKKLTAIITDLVVTLSNLLTTHPAEKNTDLYIAYLLQLCKAITEYETLYSHTQILNKTHYDKFLTLITWLGLLENKKSYLLPRLVAHTIKECLDPKTGLVTNLLTGLRKSAHDTHLAFTPQQIAEMAKASQVDLTSKLLPGGLALPSDTFVLLATPLCAALKERSEKEQKINKPKALIQSHRKTLKTLISKIAKIYASGAKSSSGQFLFSAKDLVLLSFLLQRIGGLNLQCATGDTLAFVKQCHDYTLSLKGCSVVAGYKIESITALCEQAIGLKSKPAPQKPKKSDEESASSSKESLVSDTPAIPTPAIISAVPPPLPTLSPSLLSFLPGPDTATVTSTAPTADNKSEVLASASSTSDLQSSSMFWSKPITLAATPEAKKQLFLIKDALELAKQTITTKKFKSELILYEQLYTDYFAKHQSGEKLQAGELQDLLTAITEIIQYYQRQNSKRYSLFNT